MKFPSPKLTFNIFAIIMAFSTMPMRGQDPSYHFTFSDGSLAEAGIGGSSLEERPVPGAASDFSIEKDAALGRYAAQLPMLSNGERGPALALLDSEGSFRLDKEYDSMTISCWVKWIGPDKHSDLRQGIVSTMPMEKNTGWGFSVLENGKLSFFWIDSKGGGNMRTSSQLIPKAEWTHVAMTWENDNPQKGLRFYINGEPAGIDLEYTGSGQVKANDFPILIGVLDQKNYLPLNGSIADVRIYNQALDGNAIFEIFQTLEK